MKNTTDKTYSRALLYLADLLARRDHSKKELQQKLSKKFDPQTIKKAIQYAQEQKWMLPEKELAQKVALSLHRKGKGHYYIQKYLKEKGLPSIPEDLELEKTKALQLIQKKKKDKPKSLQEKQKLKFFLANKGFSSECIHQVLQKLTEENFSNDF
ncbi:MAG: regulatory protein RecX [Bdellovibrio sp.]|nr:MAG: regulatory protein RecX [Bdellovibrio sp.]